MQDKFKIDLETGLRIDTVSPFEFGEDIIETPCLESFYQPQWNFELQVWQESASQEYIDSLKQPIELEPSLEERVLNVEQEQETIINVLTDIMGV